MNKLSGCVTSLHPMKSLALFISTLLVLINAQQTTIFTYDEFLDIDLRIPTVKIQNLNLIDTNTADALYGIVSGALPNNIVVHGTTFESLMVFRLISGFIDGTYPVIPITFVFESIGADEDYDDDDEIIFPEMDRTAINRKIIREGLHIDNEAHLAKYLNGRKSDLAMAKSTPSDYISFDTWIIDTFTTPTYLINNDPRIRIYVFAHAYDYVSPALSTCSLAARIVSPLNLVIFNNMTGWHQGFEAVVKGNIVGHYIDSYTSCMLSELVDVMDGMWKSSGYAIGASLLLIVSGLIMAMIHI